MALSRFARESLRARLDRFLGYWNESRGVTESQKGSGTNTTIRLDCGSKTKNLKITPGQTSLPR